MESPALHPLGKQACGRYMADNPALWDIWIVFQDRVISLGLEVVRGRNKDGYGEVEFVQPRLPMRLNTGLQMDQHRS